MRDSGATSKIEVRMLDDLENELELGKGALLKMIPRGLSVRSCPVPRDCSPGPHRSSWRPTPTGFSVGELKSFLIFLFFVFLEKNMHNLVLFSFLEWMMLKNF